jgi:plastocyanin
VRFNPAQVMVSKGTKVTWVNDDPYTHFVNSDPHPSHNARPALNTLELEKGDTFSFTFDKVGEIAYHCSAHVPEGMTARVLVVDSSGS